MTCLTFTHLRRAAAMTLGALVFAGAASLAEADVLVMKDGRRLTGAVRAEGDNLFVGSPLGEARVKRDDVVQWIRKETKHQAFERKAKVVFSIGDADARYQLGVEARRDGLLSAAERAFKSALDVDPDHAGARLALGFKKHKGQWLSDSDWHRAQGHVKFRGAWVPADERDQILAEEARRKAAAEARLARLRRARLEREKAEAEARAEARKRAEELELARRQAEAARARAEAEEAAARRAAEERRIAELQRQGLLGGSVIVNGRRIGGSRGRGPIVIGANPINTRPRRDGRRSSCPPRRGNTGTTTGGNRGGTTTGGNMGGGNMGGNMGGYVPPTVNNPYANGPGGMRRGD